jgi:hypothetical protein
VSHLRLSSPCVLLLFSSALGVLASATLDVRSSPAALPWASASSSPGRATIPTRVPPMSELAGQTTTPLRNTFTSMVCRAPSPPRRLALCCVMVSLPRFMAVHYLPVRVVVSRTDRPLLNPPSMVDLLLPMALCLFAQRRCCSAYHQRPRALASRPSCSRKCRAKAADDPPRCYLQALPYFSVGHAPVLPHRGATRRRSSLLPL